MMPLLHYAAVDVIDALQFRRRRYATPTPLPRHALYIRLMLFTPPIMSMPLPRRCRCRLRQMLAAAMPMPPTYLRCLHAAADEARLISFTLLIFFAIPRQMPLLLMTLADMPRVMRSALCRCLLYSGAVRVMRAPWREAADATRAASSAQLCRGVLLRDRARAHY